MGYGIPRKEDLIIEKPEKGQEFVLVKYKTDSDYDDPQLYLVSNYDKVSVSFGDDIVVSYTVADAKDKRMPNTTARVVAMFNDLTDGIMRTLYNTDYVSYLMELGVRWQGEKVICNITNPSQPKGSGSGGMSVTGQGEDGESIESSPFNGGESENGDNEGGNNGSKKGQKGSSGGSEKQQKGYDVGGFGEDKKLDSSATDEVLTGKIFTFKRKR